MRPVAAGSAARALSALRTGTVRRRTGHDRRGDRGQLLVHSHFGADEPEPFAQVAASLALTLHASAFLGEIWRGSIEAIPSGQREASTALGLRYYDRMTSVILPQAARISVAPTGRKPPTPV